MRDALAGNIRKKAIELGYDDCGIINLSSMNGYAQKLSERIALFPETEPRMKIFFGLASLEQNFPWAKSIVICVRHYGKYHIPAHLQGLIAKYYLVDSRIDTASAEYSASDLFDAFLREQGLKTETERKFGITALRWAAMQAGLSIVRKNNFFYTEKGSWVHLEAWLIDVDLKLLSDQQPEACPESCNRCITACPTKSLVRPYAMNRDSCVSSITTWDGRDMPNEKHRGQLGNWVFGCDACQDACPHNKNKWRGDEAFHGLDELAEFISLEKIVAMDYDFLENVMSSKFWYIRKKDVWKWKVNAINAMMNDDVAKYRESIEAASHDLHEKVREMAQFALSSI